MRVAYLGPEGTFTHAAAWTAPDADNFELIPQDTIRDTVLAVRDGRVERAVVPIENSLEGSVDITLDTIALETTNLHIVGETMLGVEHCLVVQERLPLQEIEVVISHPQAIAQCRRYIRSRMPNAQVLTADSTADAIRLVSQPARHRWAAIGTRLAAELYNCAVLDTGVEDVPGNKTRFVWLSSDAAEPGVPGAAVAADARWKTAIVFWGKGADSPGWLVSCLSELASWGVNLTRIESRPLRAGMGTYMFFADLDGRVGDTAVAEALDGVRARADVLRTLGSFPAAEL